MKFTVVDTSTIAGLKKAEYLVARGWTIERTGIFHIWLRRKEVK